jgi:hypothetical protein
MLALLIAQHEQACARRVPGLVGTLIVPNHDWIRGRDEDV